MCLEPRRPDKAQSRRIRQHVLSTTHVSHANPDRIPRGSNCALALCAWSPIIGNKLTVQGHAYSSPSPVTVPLCPVSLCFSVIVRPLRFHCRQSQWLGWSFAYLSPHLTCPSCLFRLLLSLHAGLRVEACLPSQCPSDMISLRFDASHSFRIPSLCL